MILSPHPIQLDPPRPRTRQTQDEQKYTILNFTYFRREVNKSVTQPLCLTLGPGSPLSPLAPGTPTPVSPWQQKIYEFKKNLYTFKLLENKILHVRESPCLL